MKLELSVSPDVIVRGDEGRLAQVFGNLLQNSLRYTDTPGVVAVRVEPGARVLWEDSAPCVPQDDLPRLTERLFRVEGSRNRASGGSGLGLAIAHAIVQAHGGTLSASASPLGGLRIEIRFPRTDG
jgi:two-component system sensor histidine kinase BaeS